MYKKITHTIVEEHFDHPVSAQIKKTLERRESIEQKPIEKIVPTPKESDRYKDDTM